MWLAIIRRTSRNDAAGSRKKKKKTEKETPPSSPGSLSTWRSIKTHHSQFVRQVLISNIPLITQTWRRNLCVYIPPPGKTSPDAIFSHRPSSREQTPWIIQPIPTFNAAPNYSVPRFIIVFSLVWFFFLFPGWGIFISIALILNGWVHVIISTLPAGWRGFWALPAALTIHQLITRSRSRLPFQY